MRSTILLTGLAGLSGLLAACGDDSGTPIDAKTDSPPGIDAKEADAAPDAYVFKGLDADEAGEVRLEYINFVAGTGARGTGFIYKTPGTPAYHDFINQTGMCTDTRMKGVDSNIWPLAQNADAEYFDVGPEIDILGTGMAPYRLAKTQSTTQKDPFGRTHTNPGATAASWYFDGAAGTDTDGATYLSAATSYDVALPGSSEFKAQYFDNAIYMPEAFNLLVPDFAAAITISATGNTDQTYTWEMHNAAPTGVEVFGLVAFTGANGPAIVCVEPNDGSMTVPGAMLDIVAAAYPSGGTIARQTLTHQVRDLYVDGAPTNRRVDMIGVWCYAKSFTVTP